MAKMIILKKGESPKKASAVEAIKKLEERHDTLIKEYQQIIFQDYQKYKYLKERLLVSRSMNVLLYICMGILGYIVYTTKGM